MGDGATSIVEAPAPQAKKGHLLIDTRVSLVSAGTERMLVNFGKGSYLDKALQQPDKVKMVLEKVKTDGLAATFDSVQSKLAQPLPLGYCNVGAVKDVGEGVSGFSPGDRVVSNGAHADVVRVPKNLCAKIPDNVSDDEAVFTVLGSIGLQGIRLAQPTLGECFVVTGVGLIGLLTVQLLVAHGCRVLAIDFDDEKLALARAFGAEVCNPSKGEDPVAAGLVFSRGQGVDGVLITASSKSSDPISEAARMSRKRGRIVLVGVTGLELNRSEFYEKELSFQVSCSYGPGRYDSEYEDKGNDYPIGFVRWTEQRNFEAVLDMMSMGQLDVKPLISHRFDFEAAERAYDLLSSAEPCLGIVLDYLHDISKRHVATVNLSTPPPQYPAQSPVVGFVGAGNYASRILIPAFKKSGAILHSISTSGGVSGVTHGVKGGFAEATTDTDGLVKSSNINTIAIVTRHDSHAAIVTAGLKSRKSVFVEKPLAITIPELEEVEETYRGLEEDGQGPRLMVGFNRRFAPHVVKMKELIAGVSEPKSFVMTVNAGAIPSDHWTQDPLVGGGRIVGEACHFIDLMRFLADSKIVSVQARAIGGIVDGGVNEDKAAITLSFEDGSLGTIHYLANGSPSFPKERVEVFTAGSVLQLDNFRKLRGFGWAGFRKMSTWRQDKGQEACANAFIESVSKGLPSPIPSEQLFEVTRATIDAAIQLRD